MKKWILFLALAWIPSLAISSNTLNINDIKAPSDIPSRFTSSSNTDTYEWGCPIAEEIQAASKGEAIEKMGQACMEDVKKAAVNKPGVFEVIQVSVIWPNLAVKPVRGGYRLEGTIFLETLVMKGSEQPQ